MTTPNISIVLPTRNGAATLPGVLESVLGQRSRFSFDVVAVDSGSTDGTVNLLRQRGVKIVSILPRDFDHGLSRNLAIEHASGELIVLLVQDAVPSSDGWLDALAAPFDRDERLAGTWARQRPRDDASAIARHYLNQWIGGSSRARTADLADRDRFESLDATARLELCTFDNVCSCIRRSVWERHPFKATPIAEDLQWAKDVLLAGYRLAYVPAAEVVHSHDRSARYEFARTCILHRRLYELFGLRTIPDVCSLARAVASSTVLHARCQRSDGIGGYPRAIALAWAWPLGQYIGALSAVRNWKPWRPGFV